MASVNVEANLPECPETKKLEAITGIEDAWRFPFRLWAWGIQNDIHDGKLRHSMPQLERLLRRSNRSLKLVLPMIESGFLTPGRDAIGDYFYMNGWERNAAYFNRKKKDRERKKAARMAEMSAGHSADIPGDVPRTKREPPSPSLSPSLHSQEGVRGEPAHSPAGLSLIPAEHIDPVMAKDLFDEYGRAMQLNKRPSRSGLLVSSKELDLCKQILRDCGSRDLAFSAAHAYAEHEKNQYWKKNNWALWLLAKDIAQAIELARLPAEEKTA